ncbi:hypothetical protein BH11PAT4_BH11PAT4_8360 [soil metagenome]
MGSPTQLPLVPRNEIEKQGLIILAEKHGAKPPELTDLYMQRAFAPVPNLSRDSKDYLLRATVDDADWFKQYGMKAFRIHGEAGAVCYAMPKSHARQYFCEVTRAWENYRRPKPTDDIDGYDRRGAGGYGRNGRRTVTYVR